MKLKPAYFFVSLLALISLITNLYFLKQQQAGNTVIEVVDGDTFQLQSGKRIRLMSVDAPEYNRCAGDLAEARLKELILNKKVTLKEEVQDAYGRYLALVYQGKNFVNKILLQEGLARFDYRYSSQKETLMQAWHEAQNQKLGIWSSLCRQTGSPPDPNCPIKGNLDKSTYTKYYHLPGCKFYDQVIMELDIGEQYFCTEQEAQEAGFRKASSCP